MKGYRSLAPLHVLSREPARDFVGILAALH
jgi:hypothetical protein